MVIHLQPDIQIGSTLDQIIFTIYGMKYDVSSLRDKGKVIDGADKGAQVLFVVVLREEEHDVRRVLLCELKLITCSFNSLKGGQASFVNVIDMNNIFTLSNM